MHRFRLALIVGAILVAAVFVAGGAASLSKGSSTQAKSGGTVVFGAEQEPPCLNGFLSGCNNTWTSWTVGTQFRGLYIQNPDYIFVPDIAQSAKVTKTKPQTVAVTIKKRAVWSDGVPVTYQDFVYTWKQHINPKNDVASRSGYDSIKSVTPTSKDGKSFNDRLLEAVRSLAGLVHPTRSIRQHALNGQPDFNNVWLTDTNNPKTGKPISNGPFIMTNYTKGQSMTFMRNPKWWGPHKPYLDKVVFVFRTNTDSEIQAIRGGEVDAIYPQPQLQLLDLKGTAGLKTDSRAGTTLEHLDYNEQTKGGFPLMRAPWVRQALAYATNRQAVVTQIFKKFNPNQQVCRTSPTATPRRASTCRTSASTRTAPRRLPRSCRSTTARRARTASSSATGRRCRSSSARPPATSCVSSCRRSSWPRRSRPGSSSCRTTTPSRLFFPRVSDGNYQIAMFAWVGTGDPIGPDGHLRHAVVARTGRATTASRSRTC